MTTTTKYDLLLKGGRVIDPANNVDGKLDVAIAGRYVSSVQKNISPQLALSSGYLITKQIIK